ncbi:MAG: LAGLIDADG family homing endonuclease [bacterium]
MREVSRAHSTQRKLKKPLGKERIHQKKLHSQYIAGFIDAEGSFSVSLGRNRTTRRGIEVRPEFEIELRADDQEILERLLITIGCGRIYDCSYDRYGWYPHVKYKMTSIKDMEEYLFPFLDKTPLQAKKAKTYKLFREIVMMMLKKEHLTDKGFKRIEKLRDKIRQLGKKAKTFGYLLKK